MKKYILSILSLIMICSTFGCSQQPADSGNENTELNNGSNEKTSLITVYDLGEDYWDEQIQEAKDYFENFLNGEIGYNEDPLDYDWINQSGFVVVDSVNDLVKNGEYLPGIANGHYYLQEKDFSSIATSEMYNNILNNEYVSYIWSVYSEIFNKSGNVALENIKNEIYANDKYLEEYLESFIINLMEENNLAQVPRNTLLMYEFLNKNDPGYEPSNWNTSVPYSFLGKDASLNEATVGFWAVRGIKDLGNNVYEIDIATTDKELTRDARGVIYQNFLRQFKNQSDTPEQATILLNIGYNYDSMKNGVAQYGHWKVDMQEYGYVPLSFMSPYVYNMSDNLLNVGIDFNDYVIDSLKSGTSITWSAFIKKESANLSLEEEKVENLLFSYLIHKKATIGG